MFKRVLIAATLIFSGCATTSYYSYNEPDKKQYNLDSKRERLTSTRLVEIVNSIKNNYSLLDIRVDKKVKVGEYIKIYIKPKFSGYLRLVVINPDGSRSLIFPNRATSRDSYLKANEVFSTENGRFKLKATEPKGKHHLLTIFCQENPYLIVTQGEKRFNAIKYDKDLIKVLKNIDKGSYKKCDVSITPIEIY